MPYHPTDLIVSEALQVTLILTIILQVFLGHNGVHDVEGNELPRLVYVSREKRPGFDHHKKAGAMNALVKQSHMHTNCSGI
jgi:hypothetical protein